MGRIVIQDLETSFRIGVTGEERARPQTLWITVTLEKDFAAAAASDALSTTIDYYEVAQSVKRMGEGKEWRLIEKLALDVADEVLKGFGPDAITVEVKKFILTDARYVSATVSK